MTKREYEIVTTFQAIVIEIILFVVGPIVATYIANKISNYWFLDAIVFVFEMIISEVFLTNETYMKILLLITENKPQTKKSFLKLCMIVSAIVSTIHFLGFIVFAISGFCYLELMKALKINEKS